MTDLKFVVRYQRKVQTRPYENMTIGLEMEFLKQTKEADVWCHTPDYAFKIVREQVEKWIDIALNGERR